MIGGGAVTFTEVVDAACETGGKAFGAATFVTVAGATSSSIYFAILLTRRGQRNLL